MLEANFDGLVGPTHNYAGLAKGNVASIKNKALTAHPKQAALEGLEKMKFLADLGIKQAIIPPQERPSIPVLKHFGFSGTEEQILATAQKQAPEQLAIACSASSMWTANAATITPSIDSINGKVNITPANLIGNKHRSIETRETQLLFKKIFNDNTLFNHHPPITPNNCGDEGAANHTRLCPQHKTKGLHLFTYGYSSNTGTTHRPQKYPARQSLEALKHIVRTHNIPKEHVIFTQQNPTAIDAGVFHNDVISTGNENVFLYHESAFLDTKVAIEELRSRYQTLYQSEPILIQVNKGIMNISEAVETYFFNSQIVSLPNQNMILLAPMECKYNEKVKNYIEQLLKDNTNPINEIQYFNLKESMSNGGGPACLRLRAILTEQEWQSIHQGVVFTPDKYKKIKNWIQTYYRDTLDPKDLADPSLLSQSRTALDNLTQILNLGNTYDFQR